MTKPFLVPSCAVALTASALAACFATEDPPVAETPQDRSVLAELAESPHSILREAYVDGNWDLWISRADGSRSRNLTRTPGLHELYPQASPDGRWIAFIGDREVGGKYRRDVYVMPAEGGKSRLVAENGRQPCWSPDSRRIAFLPGEFQRHDVTDYVTKGLRFFDIETGETTPHPNEKLHHLYNPTWSADGKWILATVHGGMGFGHAILAIEVDGQRVHDLKIPGCRPDLSPDGKRLCWGKDDHTIAVADIRFDGKQPRVSAARDLIVSREHVYHSDWSPDGRYVTVSRGPGGRRAPDGQGTHAGLAEFVGVRAQWDLAVIRVDGGRGWAPLTTDGASNKESEWLPARRGKVSESKTSTEGTSGKEASTKKDDR